MLLTLVDAIFLCAFYAAVCLSFAPFVVSQDSSYLHLAPYALVPLAGRFVMRLIIARVISRISYTVEGAVREELVRKLLRVGPLSFAVKSSLSTLFVDAIDDIMPYFSSFLVTMRYAMVIPMICLIAVAVVSPGSAGILFCMAPLIPFFMIAIGKGAERLNQRQWKQITRLAVRFQEALDKLSIIKLFNIERGEIEKIARLTKRWRVETMQVLRIAFLSALVLEFFATCGIAFCAITLGFAVYEHGFDYTRALFVLLLAPEFFLPLRQLGFTYHARMRAMGAMTGLMDLLSERDIFPDSLPSREQREAARHASEATGSSGATGTSSAAGDSTSSAADDGTSSVAGDGTSSAAGDGATAAGDGAAVSSPDAWPEWMRGPINIEFHDFEATYPNGRIGVSGFSSEFHAGEVTALVGPSGAGKSTILQSIAAFTEASAGEIVVNGHSCSRQDLLTLMARVSYIPQLPNLFYGTLRDNLKMAAPDADDEQLKQALALVGAGELLSRFADGLDHHVGDQNRGISGGETRLIALARAMLHDSAVLLLDEPTASLDRDSENRFLDALKHIGREKTVIVVAHRRELIAFADRVIKVTPSARDPHDDSESAAPAAASADATAAPTAAAAAGAAQAGVSDAACGAVAAGEGAQDHDSKEAR